MYGMYAYISAYFMYITPIKQIPLSHYQHNTSWQLVDSSAWCMFCDWISIIYHRCVTGIILKKEQKSKSKMLFCLCTFSISSIYYSGSCACFCVINCLTINKIIVMFSLRYGSKPKSSASLLYGEITFSILHWFNKNRSCHLVHRWPIHAVLPCRFPPPQWIWLLCQQRP